MHACKIGGCSPSCWQPSVVGLRGMDAIELPWVNLLIAGLKRARVGRVLQSSFRDYSRLTENRKNQWAKLIRGMMPRPRGL